MSEMPTEVHIPSWDVADRMRKSMRDCGMTPQGIADFLGVHRNTVSNWINGHVAPPRPELRLWALRTGVPLRWLQSGEEDPLGASPESEATPTGRYPAENLLLEDAAA